MIATSTRSKLLLKGVGPVGGRMRILLERTDFVIVARIVNSQESPVANSSLDASYLKQPVSS